MRKSASCIALILVSGLSGCVSDDTGGLGSSPDFARSEFAQVASGGEILSGDLRQPLSIGVADDDDVGYAYRIGVDARGNYTGLAGLHNPARIDAPTFNGEAKFAGTASMRIIDRLTPQSSFAQSVPFTAPIVVRVDLAEGTFAGRTSPPSSSADWQLTFNGTFSGGDMTGTSRLTGLRFDTSGAFLGRAGDEKAIGAFHGNNSEDVYAGGLIATR